ncbi:MAG: LL-diaminopimelate aminotransferase [Candidatus Coproplasma sp.]
MKYNTNFNNIAQNYLFAEVADRSSAYASAHPDKKVLKLGIGDVTLPLAPAVIEAMHKGVEEMAKKETFKGYGPYEGYDFLRSAIKGYYKEFGVEIGMDEIFVSDGAKSDLGNILDIFGTDNTVLVPDPVYPVYVDTNTMAGRKVIFSNATKENGFLPMPDYSVDCDIIYICSPNNPTGAAYSVEQLKEWVKYALEKKAVILYDSAYESFITEKGLARSIFEVEGARECAIEFYSFSKIAGFTGVRCGCTIIPKELGSDGMNANKLWYRRQATKYNGTTYIIQCGASAVFSKEGMAQIKQNIAYYQNNANIIASCMEDLGIWFTGGKNSPYIWLKCPNNMGSWEFFDLLLNEAQVVGTPGAGFGKNGEGFLRLTAFGSEETTKEAVARIKKILAE